MTDVGLTHAGSDNWGSVDRAFSGTLPDKLVVGISELEPQLHTKGRVDFKSVKYGVAIEGDRLVGEVL